MWMGGVSVPLNNEYGCECCFLVDFMLDLCAFMWPFAVAIVKGGYFRTCLLVKCGNVVR